MSIIEASLVLSVATVTMEGCFSATKYLKSNLHDQLGDENLRDNCICFLRKFFLDDVLYRFYALKPLGQRL